MSRKTVYIQDGTDDKDQYDNVYCNGVNFQMKRGEAISVPGYVADIFNESQKLKMEANKDETKISK